MFMLSAQGMRASSGVLSEPAYDKIVRDAQRFADDNQFARAENMLANAAASAAQQNKGDWEATLLGCLGSVYERDEKYAEAESALSRSIDQWTTLAGPNAYELVAPLGNLGGLYYKAGQFARAEKILARAVALAFESDHIALVRAKLLINLGDVYFVEHKDKEAREQAEKGLEQYALVNDPRQGPGSAYALLGSLQFRAGQFAEAEQTMRRALTVWESTLKAGDARIAEAVANLAVFYSATEQYEKAKPLFARAKAMFDAVTGDTGFVQNFLLEYAGFERKEGQKKEAKELEKDAGKLAMNNPYNRISSQVIDASALRASR
jgi:tetratricopeptide (TPR) repeat protein